MILMMFVEEYGVTFDGQFMRRISPFDHDFLEIVDIFIVFSNQAINWHMSSDTHCYHSFSTSEDVSRPSVNLFIQLLSCTF